MKYDLIIENGRVFDPGAGLDRPGALAVQNGRIAGAAQAEDTADTIVDAKGCYVSPGFIDTHVHVAWEMVDSGIPLDLCCLPNGVTGAVDGGSLGVTGYKSFLRSLRTQQALARILLNVSPVGLATHQFIIPYRPDTWDMKKFEEAFTAPRDEVLGLKLLMDRRRLLPEDGVKALDRTMELAERYQVPAVVHVMGSPVPQAEIASALRPGDVFLHVYTGGEHTILENGHVSAAVHEARERGVWMDSAPGLGNFSFQVARHALEEGLRPDLIGSDMTIRSWNRERVHGLTHVLSMHLALGLTLQEVVTAATRNAASFMGLAGTVGTLAAGARADICIFELKDFSRFTYRDTVGDTLPATELIVPQMVFSAGLPVYRAADFY